jgi:hypothetical protein
LAPNFETSLPSCAAVTPGFSRISVGESDASPLTVVTTSTAPDTFGPPTVTVFFVNASFSVGSEPAATDEVVVRARADATVTLKAKARIAVLFIFAPRVGDRAKCDADQPRSARRLCRRPARRSSGAAVIRRDDRESSPMMMWRSVRGDTLRRWRRQPAM